MQISSEIYKGIEYVRISSLPGDQKKIIYNSLNRKLVINILKDNFLLNDCLQYQHYVTWYENIYKTATQGRTAEVPTNSPTLTLALSNSVN